MDIICWFTCSFWHLNHSAFQYFGYELSLPCLSFWTFSFCHCVVCSSSIYGFWLPLWYFQAFDHCVVCSSSIYGFWLPLWYLQTLLTWWRLFHKHVVVPKIKYLPFLLSTNMNHIITRLLTCVTRRATLVVRGLLTIAAHMSSLAVFVGFMMLYL